MGRRRGTMMRRVTEARVSTNRWTGRWERTWTLVLDCGHTELRYRAAHQPMWPPPRRVACSECARVFRAALAPKPESGT